MTIQYTPAINDTRNREGASPWLRATLESALEQAASQDGSPLKIAQDAARLHTLLTDWFVEVSAGRLPQPERLPARQHYWISVHEIDAEFPDIVQARLSRDEESNMRSQLSDMQDAGEIDSYEVTEYEPDTKSHADVLEWLAGMKSEGSNEDREYCDGCGVMLEEGRIGKCDECIDAEHPATDEHRSGCVQCQREHDAALPDSGPSSSSDSSSSSSSNPNSDSDTSEVRA